MPGPGLHPEPPADLGTRSLLIRAGRFTFFRVYGLAHDPIYFGRTKDNRFDSSSGRFGVLYVSEDSECAFIETFGQSTGTRVVTESELGRRGLAEVTTTREIRLLDLVSTGGLARAGADGGLFTGDHELAQRWSDAFFDLPETFDGIYYPARHDPARNACALFDRVKDVLRVNDLGALTDRRNLPFLAATLDLYGFGLLRS